MDKIKVECMHATPLNVCVHATRTCWDSFNKADGGEKDRALIDRVGNKNKHSSVLEHLNYTFYIEGISRAVLQELARHRIASLSVKSTRYTLKELKKEEHPFVAGMQVTSFKRASKYAVMTGVEEVDKATVKALDNLRTLLINGISNDKAKYALPEAYRTSLTWTINTRSLQNFLRLRLHKSALLEIRVLAQMVFFAVPSDHQYLIHDALPDA